MAEKFRGKRYKESLKLVPEKPVPVEQALPILKQFKKTKFDESVNLVVHLGIDAKQADQMVRGSVSLPKGIGATKRVIAFVQGANVDVARSAGAVEAGADDLIKKVSDGWTEFDVAIATPDLMPKIARLGKVLGPQGKMPSPKAGTVTNDVETAVREYAAGRIEFRNDAGGNLHVVVGKVSFSDADLAQNIHAFFETVRRMKPPTAKGHYIRSATLHGSMSPGIALDMAHLDAPAVEA